MLSLSFLVDVQCCSQSWQLQPAVYTTLEAGVRNARPVPSFQPRVASQLQEESVWKTTCPMQQREWSAAAHDQDGPPLSTNGAPSMAELSMILKTIQHTQ